MKDAPPLVTIYLNQERFRLVVARRLRSLTVAQLGGSVPGKGDDILLPRRKRPLRVWARELDLRDGLVGWRVFVYDPLRKD